MNAWTGAHDSYLRSARESVLKAEERLGRIGGIQRREEDIDELRTELRRLAQKLDAIWDRHLGPDTWSGA